MGDGSWNCFCGCFVSALFFHPWAKVASSTLGFLLAGHSRVQEWECSVRFAALYDFSASTKTAISVKNKEFISLGSFSIHHFHIKKIKEFGLGELCQILMYVSQAQSSHCSQIHYYVVIVDSPRQFSLMSVFALSGLLGVSVKRRRTLRPAVQHQ